MRAFRPAALILACASPLGAAPTLDFTTEVRPLMEKHCFSCHGAEKGKGGVRLHEFHDVKALFRDPKLWENVAEQIRDGAMPPEDKPQLSDEENRRVYGKCNNPNGHGHNYVAEITVSGEPDPKSGAIVNIGELERVLKEGHASLRVPLPFPGAVPGSCVSDPCPEWRQNGGGGNPRQTRGVRP